MVAIVDALGARGHSEEEYVDKFLKSRKNVEASLNDDIEEMADRIEPKDISVFAFNDTILIAYNSNGQQPTPRQVRTFFIILLRFFLRSLSERILFRGAAAIGTFYMDKEAHTVMGKAVTDAANWYDKADWIGIHATPKTTLLIKQWPDNEIKPVVMQDYGVPLKDGKVLQAMAVNWPRSFLGERRWSRIDATRDLLKLLSEHDIPLGTERKYFNTLEFSRSIVEKEVSGGGSNMAPEVLARKRAEFVALAETAFERMFGSDEQNGLVTFDEREQRAREVTDEMARWLMAAHAEFR